LEPVRFHPIGVIRTPFKEAKGTPIQPTGGRGVQGRVEVAEEYCEGLKDLNGFSHVILLYHFHLTQGHSLTVKPYLDDTTRGVFATRIPGRPNPIGLSGVRLVRIEECTLHIEDVDIVDSTPLLDIKPYVPDFDSKETVEIGWLEKRVKNVRKVKSDGRFI